MQLPAFSPNIYNPEIPLTMTNIIMLAMPTYHPRKPNITKSSKHFFHTKRFGEEAASCEKEVLSSLQCELKASASIAFYARALA